VQDFTNATREPRIFTFTRRAVNPLELRHQDVDYLDIGHGLALQNRFVGQTDEPVNLAQHCWYVLKIVKKLGVQHPSMWLQALLHDGSEAYLGDMTKWVKQAPEMQGYRDAEKRAQRVIYEAFGCSTAETPELKYADALMVRYEAKWGFRGDFCFDQPEYDQPLTREELELVGEWEPWSWERSKTVFVLEYFNIQHKLCEVSGCSAHQLQDSRWPRGPHGFPLQAGHTERYSGLQAPPRGKPTPAAPAPPTGV